MLSVVGIVVGVCNYLIIPTICRFLDKDPTPVPIPTEIILGWFGVIGIYSAGRSAEKIMGKDETDNSK
jgi:hypothetical protein